MKKTLFSFLLVLGTLLGHAQLNMSLVSQLPYEVNLSNIWGWTAPDGTEYALVGAQNGTSIVSLADPANPEEVFLIPGQTSTWREIKTWGNYAYVTTDQPGTTDGLVIIDLTNLPASAPFYHWNPTLDGMGTLNTIHSLFIDEFGVLYLHGTNLNSGGVLYVDVDTNPIEPIYLGKGVARYAHDSYARDNIHYVGEILNGTMGVYDVSDKANPITLATQQTPNAFTHNTWLNDNSTVVFTTDEKAAAYVASYDVSDLSDIRELDRFRPAATINTSVIPHNVHVLNDYLYVSYYTDGLILVDAARPENLVEVGNFDTYLGPHGGFNGAWGVYPYFSSGNIVVSDINNGLFVINATPIRACYLEGQVTDATTGLPIQDVKVVIQSDEANIAQSNISGDYKTGQATSGTFLVRFTKVGYNSLVTQAVLENGVITILDVQMTALPVYTISGIAIQEEDGQPVPNAKIQLISEQITYNATSDNNGLFSVAAAYEGQYSIYGGVWGRLHAVLNDVVINANTEQLVVPLKKGYQDDFYFDLAWEKTADGSTDAGFWVREIPIQVNNSGQISNPGSDIPDDLGESCYLTGNSTSTNAGAADVDGGRVYLKSPVMDLTTYQDPVISYNLWFYNAGGSSTPDDSLIVRLSNGFQSIVLETVKQSSSVWRPRSEFHLASLIAFSENMTITFETGDLNANPHLVEAAVDAFLVVDAFVNGTDESLPVVTAAVMPNPFQGVTQLRYRFDNPIAGTVTVTLFDVLGRPLERRTLTDQEGIISVGENLPAGYFFATLSSNGQPLKTFRMVKVE